MKPTVVSTLIGPSFNTNQNPEMPVTAVDLQNVVASKAVKTVAAPKDKTPTAKTPESTKASPVNTNATVAKNPNVKGQETQIKSMTKPQREAWLQELLKKKELDINDIMVAVEAIDKTWTKISVLQYLKKPGFFKTTKDKSNYYGFKS